MSDNFQEQNPSSEENIEDRKMDDGADKSSANNRPEELDQGGRSNEDEDSRNERRSLKRPVSKDDSSDLSLKKPRHSPESATSSTALPELAPGSSLPPPVPISTILNQARSDIPNSPLDNPATDSNSPARTTETIHPSLPEIASANLDNRPLATNARPEPSRPRPQLFSTNSARRRRTVLEQLRYVAQQQRLGVSGQASGTETASTDEPRNRTPASVSSERRRVDELLPALLSRALSDSASRSRDDAGLFPPVRTPFATPRTSVDIQSATLSRLLYVTATITANSLLGRNIDNQANPAVGSQGTQRNTTNPSEQSNNATSTTIEANAATGETSGNPPQVNTGYGSESFDNFLRDLESGLLTGELLRYMGRPENSDNGTTETNTNSPQQMNFFRMFRFNSVRGDESNSSTDSLRTDTNIPDNAPSAIRQIPASTLPTETIDSIPSESVASSTVAPSENPEQAEVVPVLVIGIRSHVLGNDANPAAATVPSTNPQNVPAARPQNPADDNEDGHNIPMFDASTSRPLILRRLNQDEQPQQPEPVSSEIGPSQSPVSSENPISMPETASAAVPNESSAANQESTQPASAEPIAANYPTYVIYVYGAAYPANHPILTAPSLFSENPTYEDMLLLERFMGPSTKRDVVGEKDLETAPGVHKFKDIKDTLEYEKTQNGDSKVNKNMCPVCWDTYDDEDLIRKLDLCGHLFHKDCIDKWLVSCKNNCPMCRGVGIETKECSGQQKQENESENPIV